MLKDFHFVKQTIDHRLVLAGLQQKGVSDILAEQFLIAMTAQKFNFAGTKQNLQAMDLKL